MDLINDNPFKKALLTESAHEDKIIIKDSKTGEEFEMSVAEFITELGLDELQEITYEEI